MGGPGDGAGEEEARQSRAGRARVSGGRAHALRASVDQELRHGDRDQAEDHREAAGQPARERRAAERGPVECRRDGERAPRPSRQRLNPPRPIGGTGLEPRRARARTERLMTDDQLTVLISFALPTPIYAQMQSAIPATATGW